MTRLVQFPLVAGLIFGGCSATLGPAPDELAKLLQIPSASIRALRCQEVPEEPTEFTCRYRRRGAAGEWIDEEIIVAIDGSTWVVIDEPHPPNPP